jgi:hypothetical protein
MAETFSQVRMDTRGQIEYVRRLIAGESLLEQVVNDHDARSTDSLLDSVLSDMEANEKMPEDTRLGKALLDSILDGPGAHLPTRKDTMWGAINGVTHYADFDRGRTADSTLSASWFGQGATLKAKAVDVAYDMTGMKRAGVN